MSDITTEIQKEAGIPNVQNRPISVDLESINVNGLRYKLQKISYFNKASGVYDEPVLSYRIQYKQSPTQKIVDAAKSGQGFYVSPPTPQTVEDFEILRDHCIAMIDILSKTGIELTRGTDYSHRDVDGAISAIRSMTKQE